MQHYNNQNKKQLKYTWSELIVCTDIFLTSDVIISPPASKSAPTR